MTFYAWKMRRLIALAGAVAQVLTAAAQVENAWQIDDNSTGSGSRAEYFADLNPEQHAAALAGGWSYTVTFRMVLHRGSFAQNMLYSLGGNRFDVFFDLDANNDLYAVIGLPGSFLPVPLVSNNSTLARSYHDHELVYNPATGEATYFFNGVAKYTWSGDSVSGTPAGRILWGSGSSAGMDVANYHRAVFEVAGTNVVIYDAGTEGDPFIAPDPVALGWTLFTEDPGVLKSPVSPDSEAPRRYFVTTLPASNVSDTSVVLNGRVNPDAQTTQAHFEWGTTTNYGQITPVEILFGNLDDQDVSYQLVGLITGLEYHYRLVTSNAWGLKLGNDVRFAAGSAFEPVPIAGLPGVANASMVWGDYDNDGRLDFILTGDHNNGVPDAQLWRNTGSGFVNVTATLAPGLPGVRGKASWADYDNDGRLDFIIAGSAFSAGFYLVGQIWRNTGSGFEDVTTAVAPGLPAVRPSELAWGDYDSDGRLDLLIMGSGTGGTNWVFQIWRNTPGGFTNVTANLSTTFPTGVSSGGAAWGDYDNDGRLDLLMTGFTPEVSRISRIWRNTGSGFVDATSAVAPDLPGLQSSAVAWGDYDGDGWLDFAIIGDTSGSVFFSVCQIWRNTGHGFINVTETVASDLRGLRDGALAWADYDNDGRLDLLLGGQNAALTVARNNGTTFDNLRYEGLGSGTDLIAPLIYGAVGWGDYDNDGRLDILYAGYTGDGRIAGLLRNRTAAPNTVPTAPTGLAMTVSDQSVMLSWDAAVDAQTPSSALTYNVRAGTNPGGTNLVAFHADANGFRRVPAMGNSQLRRALPITGLTNGQPVYWSVQAIDGALAGGPFSSQSSVVSLPELSIRSSDTTNAIISWSPPTWGWQLEETEGLAAPWEPVSDGETNSFTVSITNAARLYRLVQP
jgi:hypothetical protein